MITVADLTKMASERLQESDLLFRAGSYDMAYYLSGYAIELTLKAVIARKLGWSGFPEGKKDNNFNLSSFHIHDLSDLLEMSGEFDAVKNGPAWEVWGTVSKWDPICRYRQVGTTKKQEAIDMIDAVKKVLKEL